MLSWHIEAFVSRHQCYRWPVILLTHNGGRAATNCALCVPRGRSRWGGGGPLYLGSHWELCSEPWVISHNSGGHRGPFVCSSTIRHTCHTWESRKHIQWQLCGCTPSFELAPSMIKRQRQSVNTAMHVFVPTLEQRFKVRLGPFSGNNV